MYMFRSGKSLGKYHVKVFLPSGATTGERLVCELHIDEISLEVEKWTLVTIIRL